MTGTTMATPPDTPDAARAPPVRRLDYLPSRRPRRRWWRWAAVVVLVALAVVGVEGRRYWPVWKQKRAVMAVERPCLDYAAPPDFVIYSDDPADVQRLAGAADPGF